MKITINEDVVLEGQQFHPESFPHVIAMQPSAATLEDVRAWIQTEKSNLLDRLALHGTLLFRGFPLAGADDFDAFIRAFDLDSFTYEESLSNAVRINKTDLVFTANEAPPEVSIFLHHEMAQTPLFPSRLFFYCEQAPTTDGQTPLCRSDVLLDQIEQELPEFVEKCVHNGVRYSNIMPGHDDPESGQGRSWRSTLGVTSKSEAESFLDKLGYRYEWLANEVLRATTAAMPAVRTLQDGRRVFFNQLIAAFRGWSVAPNDSRKAICFGDDSDIPTDAMQRVSDLADDLSFDVAWQTGDVALVDNFLVMHGRRPFSGKRCVLVSLVSDDGSRLAA